MCGHPAVRIASSIASYSRREAPPPRFRADGAKADDADWLARENAFPNFPGKRGERALRAAAIRHVTVCARRYK